MSDYDVVTVVGNRPQFVKMAPLSKSLKNNGLKEFIIHSGQHYDGQMNACFFQELGIPSPDLQLSIKGQMHGEMTGHLLIELEAHFAQLKPRLVLVYGDTNTTLAATLAAVKLHIPIAHVEAGPRCYDLTMPEEVNRLVADKCSTLRFCPDQQSVDNLAKEGITEGVHLTGDLMFDAFLSYEKQAKAKQIHQRLGLNKPYVLATFHRPSNTDSHEALTHMIQMLAAIPETVVFPLHPRTKARLEGFDLMASLQQLSHVVVSEPLGYLDTMGLVRGASYVVTDSGGLQKEAFFAGKPAGVFLQQTPWPQIEAGGYQQVMGTLNHPIDREKMDGFLSRAKTLSNRPWPHYFGDGSASEKIAAILKKTLQKMTLNETVEAVS